MLAGLLVDLVPFGAAFEARQHAWTNNPSQYWTSGGEWRFASRAMVDRDSQQRRQRRERSPNPRIAFGIQTKPGPHGPARPIGIMTIKHLQSAHRVGMLGARIGEPDYWGGGYGSDALALVIDHAFNWLDLRRLWLKTTSINARVQRQMETFGFVLEARQRAGAYAGGERTDWLFYGLLREEWPGYAAMVEPLKLREKAARAYGNADPD